MKSIQAHREYWRRTARPLTPNISKVLCAVILLGVASSPSYSEPHDLNTCLSFWRKYQAAQTNHLQSFLAMKDIAEKRKLSKAQLDEVRTYLKTVEQLRFRCRRFIPPPPGTDVP